MDREEKLEHLLSEGLDLCVRARNMDEIDRREAALKASCDPADYVALYNISNPDQKIGTKSGTLPMWVQDQYEKDLADWEHRARAFLLGRTND